MSENLWTLREQKKVSVAALANRAGLPIGLLMEYESGQRGIDPRHLARLARALYVDEAEIKLTSDPRPGAGQLERQPRPNRDALRHSAGSGRSGGASSNARNKSRSPKPDPRPPAPARPSQIAHLQTVIRQLNRTPADLEAEIGKPLDELDRVEMSGLLRSLQDRAREQTAERRRAYLPEAVDAFEARYLEKARADGIVLQFELFDGSKDEGRVIGFGPYSITIMAPDGAERTLNKLALVSYSRQPRSATDQEAGS